MALNMETIEKMPILQKALILAGVVLLLVGLFYYFVEMPQGELIHQKDEDLCTKMNGVKQLSMQNQKLGVLKNELIPKYNRRKEDYQKQLPNNMEMEQLLQKINDLGLKHGIKATSFQLGKENKVGSLYLEVPIDMKFSGSFPYVMKFFYEVTQLDRIISFRGVAMKSSKSGGEIEITCTASTYRFIEK